MTNRLRNNLRIFLCCVGLIITLASTTRLLAQPGFFNFNYNGPDSLLVGVNCNNQLQGNIPNPIVSSTVGATITMSMFDDVSSGFPFNQPFTAGEVAHVFWFVKDNMGHSNVFEFFIRFVDHSPPVFNLTGIGDTLYFASVVQVPPPPNIPIADNCTGYTSTFVETTRPDTCKAGTFTRTWTATDQAGNKSTFKQTIIIAADITPPTITFPPQNGSAACNVLNTAYPAWLAAQMAAFTAQDPSGIKSLTNNGPASFPPGCKIPLTVTFKATDNCNLMIPTTAVFSTSDTKGPVVVTAPKDTVAYCSPGGNHLTKLYQWINKRAFLQVFDSCSAPITYTMKRNGVLVDSAAIVAAFWASFDNPCGQQTVGGHMVNKVSAFVQIEFIAQDACGNPTNCGQAIFAAVDTLPPVITGVNTTEACGGGNDQTALQTWINAKGNATYTDDCSMAFWTGYTFTTSNGQSGSGTFNNGPYPTIVANNCNWFTDVTFNASDECGNASSKTLRFQIVDNEPPVFTGLAPNITVYCPNPLPTVPAATITDNCDLSLAISFTRLYKDTVCAGSYTVLTTWKATDDCGNTTTITQNIFVQDTTKPVFTLVPTGIIVRCDTFVLPPVPVQGMNINATDICSPVVSITTSAITTQNPNPALCGHYSYNINRIFTATDQCGNTRTATQIISVIDNQPPVPGGVLDTIALCSALTPFPAPAPIAIDACAGPTTAPVYVSTETLPGACAGQYTLKLHWIASDVCGNQSQFDQFVHVIDSVAPTLSNVPANITVECNAIPAPPNTASFNATDNCDGNPSVTFVETEIRNPSLTSCDHWTNYTIRRQWTAMDDCGKARTYTQNIQVVDTTPPVLVAPPAIALPNDMGNCGTTIPIPAPISVIDLCTSGTHMVSLKDTMAITGANVNLPVDTMVLHFSLPNLPPNQPAVGPVTLTIFIEVADADGPQEYFNIYGENDVFLDTTARQQANVNCSPVPSVKQVMIQASLFNDWTSDGDLAITLAPNGLGGNAINPICTGARVRANLDYSYSTQNVPLTLKYSLDGGAAANFPPVGSTFLSVGPHTVVYTATDCVGNSSTASVQIQVNDTQPPVITAPAPITAFIGANCVATINLPFPSISENCEMSGHLKKSSPFYPLHFITNPDAPGLVPADVPMTIPMLIPNAISNGVLTIRFKGDNDNTQEYFNIYQGLNPPSIMSTNHSLPAGSCYDTILTTLSVPPATINNWAQSGTAMFKAVANTTPGPGNDFDFINLCGPILPDQSDGVSRIQAELEYSYAIVDFIITRNPTQTLVAQGGLQGAQTPVPPLPPGNYTVKYTTLDNAGLMGMTYFSLVVRDTVKPVAKCKATVAIQVNPSGLNNYTLLPSQVNNGSTDNCPGALTYTLSQSTFTCNQAGNNYIVTMTVRDTSGNTSTCTTIVSVKNLPPLPTVNSVCEGDTMFLFANPPPGMFSSFAWAGPLLSTTDINPVRYNSISAYVGLYTVTITGFTGCTSSGSVNVTLANLAVPDIQLNGGPNFCQGQNLILSTSTSPIMGVTYMWYRDSMSVPILMTTTSFNSYTIFQPTPGQYRFYVKIKIGDCLTPNSNIVTVNVFSRPVALVGNDSISLCAGETLALSTPISAPGLTYLWSGPNGFPSTAQNPLVSNAATQANAGIYTLKTFQNGCESIPSDTTVVTIKYTPPKPSIPSVNEVCVGNSFTFLASGVGTPLAALYEWLTPLSIKITTPAQTLVIPSMSKDAHCGNWFVRAKSVEGCYSPWSDPYFICPQDYPIVSASSNSPVCEGSPVNLSAVNSVPGLTLNWAWTLPDGSPLPGQNPVVTPAQTGVYQVIAKTSFKCADTSFVSVQVIQPPSILGIQNTSPVCVDSFASACLNPTFTSLYDPFTFTWKKSGVPNPVAITQNLCFNPVVFANNGTYTFTVTDKYGCVSAPAVASINLLPYVVRPLMTITPNPICAGGTVTLTVTNNGDYNTGAAPEYHWITPQGTDTMTAGPQLVLTNITVAQAGNYKVYVRQGVCQSVFSDLKALVVNPIPPTPIATSTQPVCIGSSLNLNATVIPGAAYFWSGPNGFSRIIRNPTLDNVTLADEGTYTVHVVVNGCTSGSGMVAVDVMVPPTVPVIVPASPNPVCLGQLPIAGFINVSTSSQTLGATYTWINVASTDTVQKSTSPILNFANLPDSLLTPGVHMFQVVAWKEDNPNGQGCSTPFSNIISVRFDTIPDVTATTDSSHKACVTPSTPILLNAQPLTDGITGKWKQTGGTNYIISNPNSPTTQFSGPAGTYSFSWCLTNGGCVNFSCTTLEIIGVPPEKAIAGVDSFLCSGSNFALYATQGMHSYGTWNQLGQIGVNFADMREPRTPVTGLNPGNQYFFVWTLDDIGCGLTSDTVRIRYASVKPFIPDNFVCTGQNCTQLQAPSLQNWETGVWSSQSNLVFTPPNNPTTTVCGLVPGVNRIYWTTNGDYCGNNSRDTVDVTYEIFPIAKNDTVMVEFGTAVPFQVLTNDLKPTDPPTVTIITQPMNGTVTENNMNGSFTYRPNSGFSGDDALTYRICNPKCGPLACSTATVFFTVSAAGACEIPTVITPNGDGFNDVFKIPGDCYFFGEGQSDLAEVTIFNQWGDFVYHEKAFTPNSFWDPNSGGQELPAGTYYYVIKFEAGGKARSNFLLIQR